MAFEPLYDVVKADYKKRLGSAQALIECKLIPDGGAAVAKVLSISCDGGAAACELLTGEARVSGRVKFRAVFLNAEGGVGVVESGADFSEKIAGEAIAPGMRAEAVCAVLDTDTVSVSAGEMKLSCLFELALYGLASEPVVCFKGAGGEVFTNKEKIDYRVSAGCADESFTVSEEKQIKDNVTSVLLCEGGALLKEAVCLTDAVRFVGSAYLNALCETEDKRLISLPIQIDFEQEVAARGVQTGCDAHADVCIKAVDVRLEKDSESDTAVLRVEAQVAARAEAYTSAEAEYVSDAFSVTNELKINAEDFRLNRYLFGKPYNEKIEGSAALEAGMPYMDTILALAASRVNVAGAFCEAGKIRLEGVIDTCVIYRNAETDSKNSVQVELPYSVTLPCDGAEAGATAMARGVVTDISARPKRGAEVEISARIGFNADVYGTAAGRCVKEIELGAPRAAAPAAVAVYITRKGETLWDVAKALRTTPESIMTFNPALKVPLEGKERVLVYRRI
ncbi:hypothetical protein FACS1894211_11930 [Clostridia bacterium]|nr:hypothetical protein FACS1894211_11930 [Clostridia bacterium]